MTDRQTTAVPIAIDKVRQRFELWRSTRPSRRARIPAGLWSAAVRVARQHGLYPTARTLHLDYTALKKRVATGDAEVAASATFVELTPATSASTCVIDIAGPRGVTMRVQVTGSTWPDLVALTRVVCHRAT
jgi:hypothetical protein